MKTDTWSEDGPFERADYADPWEATIEEGQRIRDVIRENGVATAEPEITFKQGDDWISQQEQFAE